MYIEIERERQREERERDRERRESEREAVAPYLIPPILHAAATAAAPSKSARRKRRRATRASRGGERASVLCSALIVRVLVSVRVAHSVSRLPLRGLGLSLSSPLHRPATDIHRIGPAEADLKAKSRSAQLRPISKLLADRPQLGQSQDRLILMNTPQGSLLPALSAEWYNSVR